MIQVLALLLFAFAPLFAQSGIAEQYNAIYSNYAEQATLITRRMRSWWRLPRR